MLAPQRLALSGPTLVRLLARFGDAEVPESRQSISDHLSQWLGWTDAIALSTALSVQAPGGEPATRVGASAEQSQSERVRAALRKAIAGEGAPARRDGRRTQAASQPADVEPDFADFRQRYLALQQAMETDIAALRARLRAALAARAPALARLATVDTVMEQALGARERSLLAGVPALLGAHFERQRAAAATESSGRSAAEGAARNAWLAGFRKDMQSVLLAELEIRFQPVEGLLAALRTS
ncbi:uncharacterized protein DUF3348 [Paraburkholderia silvatlantica]|uniref:Uncharacterized protein DUF3348 n=1 Tax=Paraburkholderia silvatlantica TaxID=321895 RepID=A0A2V4TEN8_9BURK|nr:DUF3348 domain-containing protein [Paraburkholderia silvatlantica]PYE22251.1 uncharacterized protein DUF3348 [Paraburkholderia silvatlantica]